MTKKIITHLHLRCYLLSAEISTCFMVLTILDKTTLTGNYKLPKNYCSIFKNLPARRSDFLQAHDFHELHLKKSTCYFFSLKLCGHCWLENSKSATRITEMGNWIALILNCFICKRSIIQIQKFLGLSTTQTMLHIYNNGQLMVIDWHNNFCDQWKALPNSYHDRQYIDVRTTFTDFNSFATISYFFVFLV